VVKVSKKVSMIATGLFVLCAQAMASDKDVIDYREGIMKAMKEQSAALGQILSGAVPDDNAVAHLNTIAVLATTAPKAFEAKVQGGEAKARVWADWPDFSKRMDEFVQKITSAAKTANEQGKDAALGTILDALDCKSCHDVYRQEKKDSKS
jgi:cytochrome c556